MDLFRFFYSLFMHMLRCHTAVAVLTQTHATIPCKILWLQFQYGLYYVIKVRLVGEPTLKNSFCKSTEHLESFEGISAWMGADSDTFALPVPWTSQLGALPSVAVAWLRSGCC